MGQVASLFRITPETAEEIGHNDDYSFTKKETLYVDKLWEPIMFIFGNGFVGREPFCNIFMPLNKVDTGDDEEEWEPGIRFHGDADIRELNAQFEKISETVIRQRIDVEKINKVVAYQITADYTEELVKLSLELITFFQQAETEGDWIVGAIG